MSECFEDITNYFDHKLLIFSLESWEEIVMLPDGEFERLALSPYRVISATPELRKFTAGFLLKEILDRFTNKLKSTLSPNRSLWMYFVHDYKIASMLNSLGLKEVFYNNDDIFLILL